MSEMTISATGILWYRTAKEYRDMLAIFVDADILPDTYEDWLAKAEAVEKIKKAEGVRPIRAYIEPSNFSKWCADNGYDVDAHGRLDFAAAFAAKIVLKEQAADHNKTALKK